MTRFNCDCTGVMHLCSESWEYMRKPHGMTPGQMEAKLAPARAKMRELRAVRIMAGQS